MFFIEAVNREDEETWMNHQVVMSSLCDNISILVELRRDLLKWLSPLGSHDELYLHFVISLAKDRPEKLLHKQT